MKRAIRSRFFPTEHPTYNYRMNIDLSKLTPGKAYGLLTNLIVPRPIAWIVSADANGTLNCAPFSFFNMLGQDPPIIGVGIGNGPDGKPKHSAQNIVATGQFVLHFVTEKLAHAMNITATDFPAGDNELIHAKLTTAPSTWVKVPRIAEASAALECRYMQTVRIGNNNVIFGQVLGVHVDDSMIDAELHVTGHAPIGRLGSPNQYCTTNDRFEIPRISYSEWVARRK